MKGMAEGLGAAQRQKATPVQGVSGKKENPARFGGWMLQIFTECRGRTTTAPGGPRGWAAGHPPQVDPQAKDRWGTGRLEVAAGAPAASRQTGEGWGLRGSLPRPRRAGPFPPRSESDLFPTPFPPKNTFLAKSRRQEGDAAREASGEAAAARVARSPGPRTRARAAPSAARPPSSVPLTQRPSRPPF